MASVTRLEFAQRLLRDLGAPTCQNNLQALVAWMRAEGTRAAWNPLATTLRWPGSTDFNSAGVQNYASLDDGVHATANTLFLRYYDGIRAAFARCAPPWETAHEVAISRWGTGPLVEQVLPSVLASWPRDGQVLVSGPPYGTSGGPAGGGGVVASVGDWVADGVSFVEGAIGAFVRVVLSPVVDLVRAAVRKLLEWVNAGIHFVAGLLTKALDDLRDFVLGLARTVRDIPGFVWDNINALWSRVVAWVDDHLRAFAAWLNAHVIQPIWDFIRPWWDRFIDAARWVISFGDRVARWVLTFGDAVADLISRAGRWLVDFALGVGRWLVDFARRVGMWLWSFAEGVGKVLVGAFESVGKALWDFLAHRWMGLKWLFDEAIDFLRFLWDRRRGIVRFFTDPLGWLVEHLERLLAVSRRWFVNQVTAAFEENADRVANWLVRWWGE